MRKCKKIWGKWVNVFLNVYTLQGVVCYRNYMKFNVKNRLVSQNVSKQVLLVESFIKSLLYCSSFNLKSKCRNGKIQKCNLGRRLFLPVAVLPSKTCTGPPLRLLLLTDSKQTLNYSECNRTVYRIIYTVNFYYF